MKYILANMSLAVQIGLLSGALLGSFFVLQSIWILLTIPFVIIVYWLYSDIRLLFLLFGLIAMIGMGYYLNITISQYKNIQAHIPDRLDNTEMTIQSSPRIQPFGYQYKARIQQYNAYVFITIANSELQYGESIVVTGKTQIPENQGIQRFLLGKHIHRYVTASEYRKQEKNSCFVKCYSMRLIADMRQSIINSIDNAYPSQVGEFLKGILIGYTDTLPEDIKESFKRTGVSHVLAVSGYNMAIIVMLVYQQLINREIGKKYAFVITVIVMGIFTLLTGAEASIMRAGVFAFIILLAEQLQHYVGGFRPLILCATILMVINPLYIGYDIGFQLSFLAVIGLIIYGQVWKSYGEGIPSLGILTMIGETFFAQIAVLPILIYYFGQISVISIAANILIVPIIPFAMAWGSVTSLFFPWDIFTYPLIFLITIMLRMNQYLAAIEWASITIPSISGLTVGIIYGVIGIIYWIYRKYKGI